MALSARSTKIKCYKLSLISVITVIIKFQLPVRPDEVHSSG